MQLCIPKTKDYQIRETISLSIFNTFSTRINMIMEKNIYTFAN